MEKWRKEVGLAALASAALLAFAPSAADANFRSSCDSCDTCNPCDWNCGSDWGGIDLGVDFLWWKPSISDLHSSVRFGDEEEGETRHHRVCPDWQPGVRVYFLLPRLKCNFGLYGSYTFVDVNQRHRHHRHEEDGLKSKDEDHSKHRFQFDYHEWDLLATYDGDRCGCDDSHHFAPFFGLAGIVLNHEHRNRHHEDTGEWHHRADSGFWAVGLRAGAAYKFRICDGFHVFAFGHGSLIAGTNENNERHHEHHKHRDRCAHVVPGLHLGTGVSYNTCFCDWDFNVRIGYEFLVWWDVPTGREFIAGNEENWRSHSRNERNIAFQGLFVGAGIGF